MIDTKFMIFLFVCAKAYKHHSEAGISVQSDGFMLLANYVQWLRVQRTRSQFHRPLLRKARPFNKRKLL